MDKARHGYLRAISCWLSSMGGVQTKAALHDKARHSLCSCSPLVASDARCACSLHPAGVRSALPSFHHLPSFPLQCDPYVVTPLSKFILFSRMHHESTYRGCSVHSHCGEGDGATPEGPVGMVPRYGPTSPMYLRFQADVAVGRYSR